jgi:hypothetical protein
MAKADAQMNRYRYGDDTSNYDMVRSPEMHVALRAQPALYKLLLLHKMRDTPNKRLPTIDDMVTECVRDPGAITEQYVKTQHHIYSAWKRRVEMGYDSMGIHAVQDSDEQAMETAVLNIMKHLWDVMAESRSAMVWATSIHNMYALVTTGALVQL